VAFEPIDERHPQCDWCSDAASLPSTGSTVAAARCVENESECAVVTGR
jgi:hypothetical protein